MKIIVKDSNREKIQAVLDEVQKRSRVRCIRYNDIAWTADLAEYQLKDLSKAEKVGCWVDVDENAQDFPGSYKGTPESTQYRLERTSTGWALVSVYRAKCKGSYYRRELNLTDEAKAAVVRLVEHFGSAAAARYSKLRAK